MSDTPNLDELRSLSLRLAALVGAPEPGFFSWRSMLSSVLDDISQFRGRQLQADRALEATALVEVARRAASSSGIGDETATEIADRVAREYLAERGLR